MSKTERDDGKAGFSLDAMEDFILRDEVRWLKAEDSRLFRFLRESMNKIEPAYVATYPPTECGIATFTKDVVTSVGKYTPFSKPHVIAVRPAEEIEPYERVVRCHIYRNDRQSYLDAAKYVNESSADVVSVQHEFGIYGGGEGEYILDFIQAVERPVATTLHTVLHSPNPDQMRVTQELARLCDAVVVMVEKGRQILLDVYGLAPEKVVLIPHGVPNVHRVSASAVKRALGIADRKIISTFGLISRGKGIEYAIKALPAVVERHPDVLYLVLGETHPMVRSGEGEAYRNCLLQKVRELGLEKHVRFNNRFLTLTELVRYLCATDVYVTPYLNLDQIVSGTLAYALGCGKAIVSTPYLYAQEVLADGRGIIVNSESPKKIANAVNNLLEDAQLKESLETAAYKYGRRTAWFNVAIDYLDLFHRLMMKDRAVRAGLKITAGEEL